MLQRLLGISKRVLGELVEKGIAVCGAKRASYRLETVTRYCAHLRDMAIGGMTAPNSNRPAGLLFIGTATRLFIYEKPISRLVPLSRFFIAFRPRQQPG